MALKDTLVRLKRRQDDAASFEAEKPSRRDEWIAAVSDLVDDFKAFLAPFEADGDLVFEDREVSIVEDLLGTYTARAVTIDAGPAKIELTPIGRVVVGALGRVDLSRQGYPRSSDRILILRLDDEQSGVERWMVRMPVELGSVRSRDLGNQTRQFDFEFLSFDRENIEKAIDFLLRL